MTQALYAHMNNKKIKIKKKDEKFLKAMKEAIRNKAVLRKTQAHKKRVHQKQLGTRDSCL
jgi:hypothetical protein